MSLRTNACLVKRHASTLGHLKTFVVAQHLLAHSLLVAAGAVNSAVVNVVAIMEEDATVDNKKIDKRNRHELMFVPIFLATLIYKVWVSRQR
jgi:hypothetical protein